MRGRSGSRCQCCYKCVSSVARWSQAPSRTQETKETQVWKRSSRDALLRSHSIYAWCTSPFLEYVVYIPYHQKKVTLALNFQSSELKNTTSKGERRETTP